jgi:regulator of sirC expression with transglutaminase-like and TPR domain
MSLLLLLLLPLVAAARSEDWVQQVVRDAADSVVSIMVAGRDGGEGGLGSGFVVAADGLIATNLHVIGEARPITVRFRDGRQFAVTSVHASDRQLDLAVVRIDAHDLKPLSLAAEDEPIGQGESIVAVGHPLGLRHSVVSGVISGEREIEGQRMLQVALPIEAGNSGGPLLDRRGRVLGIVTLKAALTANLGFAMPAAALNAVLARPNPMAMDRWMTIGTLDADLWTPVFGARWQQKAGQILVSESGSGFGGRTLCLWGGSLPEGAFEFGAYVRLDNEAGAAGLVFGADGHDLHYGFYPSAGRLRLTHFAGPTVYSWQVLEEFSSPHYRPGEWNHLKVRIDGPQLVCFVNDQRVLQRTLSSAVSGQIGLAKFRDTQPRFRDFAVGTELPPSQLSAERLTSVEQQLDALAAEPSEEPASEELIERLAADPLAAEQAIRARSEQLRRQAVQLTQLAQDIHVRDICRQLSELFQRPDAEISLAEAALLVSRLDNRELNVAAYQQQLERMAHAIAATTAADATPADRLAALNRYLFAENGFHGSRTNYYQAVNSYLDRVLDDREGLPITLAVIYLELAERLKLPVQGVGLPGHFVVRYLPADGEAQLIDVFNGGETLTIEQARQLSLNLGGAALSDADLTGMDKRSIVLRMVRNLHGVAQQQRDIEALLRYAEAMVAIAPDDPQLRGMRAMVRAEAGRKQAAIADLDWLLAAAPEGIDLELIRKLKRRLSADADE